MDAEILQWATSRGLSENVLSRMRVEGGAAQFGHETPKAIVFGYYRDGNRVNYKARRIDTKAYKQEKGGEQRFYNLDKVLDGVKDTVWITEGEMDALSIVECGIAADNGVLSVPTGAPADASDEPGDMKKYQYVLDALEGGLSEVSRFVIATDNDSPGRALRSDLVALLGAAKCWFVDFPEGVKDANEALVQWGAEDLKAFLTDGQQEWPIEGIYTLDQVPEPPKLELWEPGFPEWESRVKLAARTLSVFTGIPGHGKTHFSQQIWFNIARKYGIRVALLSAETGIKPHVRKNLRQFYFSKAEFQLTDEEKREADEWISQHFVFVNHPNARPTFPWLCEMIEAAHARHGCRAFVCDPWNKLESNYDRRKQSETQWIGECLDDLLDLTRSLDMHIQIVAHPAKPTDPQARNRAPDLYSISGSAHWSNRVDQGFSISRPKLVDEDGNRSTGCEFYHLKTRFEELGWPCKLPMRLDDNKCFRSSEYENSAGVVV
jgi:twinkle protein